MYNWLVRIQKSVFMVIKLTNIYLNFYEFSVSSMYS